MDIFLSILEKVLDPVVIVALLALVEKKWGKTSDIKKAIATLSEEFHEDRAKRYRNEILRFADEIRMGWEHSKDSYENVLDCITNYNNYCSQHPSFKNDMTMIAQDIIINSYKKRIENNDFV